MELEVVGGGNIACGWVLVEEEEQFNNDNAERSRGQLMMRVKRGPLPEHRLDAVDALVPTVWITPLLIGRFLRSST